MRVGDGQRVFEEMQKLGVIVRPMGGYQLPEWMRISIGTPKENKRCLEALKTGSLRRQIGAHMETEWLQFAALKNKKRCLTQAVLCQK